MGFDFDGFWLLFVHAESKVSGRRGAIQWDACDLKQKKALSLEP